MSERLAAGESVVSIALVFANTTTVLSLVVAILGVALAGLTTVVSSRQKSREMFYQALDLLSGRTQRRNIGIAVIESLWNERLAKRFVRDISVPLLANSAIYLLLESDESTEHELNNLRRIMDLLCSERPKPKFCRHYQYLADAVQQTTGATGRSRSAGLPVPELDLSKWSEWLRANTSALSGQAHPADQQVR
jgi:hypothetical protein